ncbi:hypothetical protein D1AOALGA4SA_3333, partial [Olavius algarvensis Delta 1 endosymbiont]
DRPFDKEAHDRPFDKEAHDRPFDKEAHDKQNTLFDFGRSMLTVRLQWVRRSSVYYLI